MEFSIINNRYRIRNLLGEGGTGRVYLAEDLANSNRPTAIKTIKASFLKMFTKESLAIFKHEYEIMSRLWHPNLAKVYDFGELNSGYYLAMEYIKGRELNKFIRENKDLDIKEKLPMLIDLLRAIDFIHSRNIIYSDIKPQNILINKDHQIKLIDFGLSDFEYKISRNIKGTLAYLAPEIINGKERDHRADIFSLGMLFYEILTGKVFYFDSSFNAIIGTLTSQEQYKCHKESAIMKLGDIRTREIIQKMCSYYPLDRYSSCAEIIIDINRKYDENYPVETQETKESYVTGVPFIARNKEMKYFVDFLKKGNTKLFLILGKEGIGKSRLLKEFKKHCNLSGLVYFQGSSIRGEPYEPFLTMVNELLFIYEGNLSNQQKIYLKRLLPNHPVLAPYDSGQNDGMDARSLKNILVDTISSILINYGKSTSNNVVLVFENLTNADEISLEIINEILYKMKLSNIDKLKLYAECRAEEQENISDFLIKLKDRDRLELLEIPEFTKHEVILFIRKSFGVKSLDNTISKNIKDIYDYCGGNPLFLQELMKKMVLDESIQRKNIQWEFVGDISKTKLSLNIEDIIKKRIIDLKLTDDYYKALVFLSFSTREKLFIDFYQNHLKEYMDINWQDLFDILARKEFLHFKDNYYTNSNRIYQEIIKKQLKKDEAVKYHKLWVMVLEKYLSPDLNINEIDDQLLYDLSYHYQKCRYTDTDLFINKSAGFLLELAKREKAKYSNNNAIKYFIKLLKELNNFDSNSEKLMKIRLEANHNLARVYEVIGKWDRARVLYEENIQLARKLKDKILEGESKNYLGRSLSNISNYEEAKKLFTETKYIGEKYDNKEILAFSYGQIGAIFHYQSDYDKAMENYEMKRQICKELNDDPGYSEVLGKIGLIYRNQGKYEMAMKYYQEMKDICHNIGDISRYCTAIGSIASLNIYQGNYDKAMKLLEEQKKICSEMGDKHGISSSIANMVIVYHKQRNYEKAMLCCKEQMHIFHELGDRLSYSKVIGNIGSLYAFQGEFDKALQYFSEKKQICLELKNKRGYSITVFNIGLLYRYQSDYDNALKFLDESIIIARELKLKYFLCSFLASKGEILFDLKDYESSQSINKESMEIALEIHRNDIIFSSRILEYKLLALYEPQKALKKFKELLKREKEEESIAIIHSEIYTINRSVKHHQKALKIYRKLHKNSPEFGYLKKIEELTQTQK